MRQHFLVLDGSGVVSVPSIPVVVLEASVTGAEEPGLSIVGATKMWNACVEELASIVIYSQRKPVGLIVTRVFWNANSAIQCRPGVVVKVWHN
jgi:hypothetical protein